MQRAHEEKGLTWLKKFNLKDRKAMAGASLYLETRENPALAFTQRSAPVEGVYWLNVENGPLEQLHHVPPQLCSVIQA